MIERSIIELRGMLGAKNVDPADRAEMELGVISRTDELMRLGKRLLELGAAVTVASRGIPCPDDDRRARLSRPA